jgi:hypothetical protein
MIHEITHMLGLCGEKHFNLLGVILDWQNISPIFNYIKTLLK